MQGHQEWLKNIVRERAKNTADQNPQNLSDKDKHHNKGDLNQAKDFCRNSCTAGHYAWYGFVNHEAFILKLNLEIFCFYFFKLEKIFFIVRLRVRLKVLVWLVIFSI